uniref:Serine-threonine/tyrosine-protein kinase catalytic domain-containing protein n=1 Tax=Brassica oleracea var. oleracea TaxID=109376 RepID=A0A0D3AJ14_BRAOL
MTQLCAVSSSPNKWTSNPAKSILRKIKNNFRVVDSKMFLELVTGRNPVGEFGDGVDIVQWVRKMTDSHKESVVKVLDPRLTSIPLHEVTDVFYVAMLCVEEQAVERPTMREVILESFCS